MSPTDTSEKGLETLIETSLLTSGYIKSESSDYNRTYCIDKTQLLQFLRTTQPTQIAKLETNYNTRFEEKLFQRISEQIKTKGIIEILRNGIKAGEVSLTLYYKQPASQLNPQASQNYNQNIFSVTRQLHFSNDKKRPKHLSARQVVDKTAKHFQIQLDDMVGPKRDKDIVVPRQVAMYILRSELHLSVPKIAHELGRKDHTTAIHSVEKIEKEMNEDPRMRQHIIEIKEKLYA